MFLTNLVSEVLEEGIDVLDIMLDYRPDYLGFLDTPLSVGQVYLMTIRGFLPEKK